MKERYEVQMGSYRALQALFENMETSAIAGLPEAVAAFNTEVESIVALLQQHDRQLKPVLVARDEAVRTMTARVIHLAGRALGYARRVGNAQLAATMRLDPDLLTRAGYQQRMAAAQAVLDRINASLPLLTPGGITPNDVVAVQEAIADAQPATGLPRNHIAQRKKVALQLRKKFSDVGLVVREQLDPLFRAVRYSDPGIYTHYIAARRQLHRAPSQPVELAPVSTASSTSATDSEVKRAA